MDDLISRQAAIEAICKAWSLEGDYHKCDGYPETSTWCDELVALRALPSADRPQGWVDKAISIIDAMQKEGIIDYEQAWEFRMRARMKGADDEQMGRQSALQDAEKAILQAEWVVLPRLHLSRFHI